MKKTDLAYIAGIIDGEGYIGLQRRKNQATLRIGALTVGVVNTSEWLCRYLQFCFGGRIRARKDYSPKHRKQWYWEMDSGRARTFLEAILPYLKLKKAEAELGILFQKSKKPSGYYGKHRRKSTEVLAVEQAQAILMSELKRK